MGAGEGRETEEGGARWKGAREGKGAGGEGARAAEREGPRGAAEGARGGLEQGRTVRSGTEKLGVGDTEGAGEA